MPTRAIPISVRLPKPTEKQVLFLTDRHKVVLFGGARGGGKSFAIRLKAILACLKHPRFKCIIVRRTYPELISNHVEPICDLLKIGQKGSVARYNKAEKEITFLNGSKIMFRYCDSESALNKFQGLECDFLFVDEATNIPEEWLKKLFACVRGTNGYPKRIYMTGNPGGISHGYVRRLKERRFDEGENPDDYSFIQSLVYDNKVLMREQPDYVKQLESLPPKLRDAWLNGRWDVFEGCYFEEFRETPDVEKCHEAGISIEKALEEHRWTHVIEPFEIPSDWKISRSYDFGYGKPFSCAWWATDYEGVAYRILELYGCTKTPNEGVKWNPSRQFKEIARVEREHPWLKGKTIRGVADPSIWDGSRGISVYDEAEKCHLWFEPGINDRIPGWLQVRERMKFDSEGKAMMYFFSNCRAIIRCMPLMTYDDHNVEDLDTDMEDHCLDDCRYFCMMNPIPPRKIETKPIIISDPLDQFKTEGGKWNPYVPIIRRE